MEEGQSHGPRQAARPGTHHQLWGRSGSSRAPGGLTCWLGAATSAGNAKSTGDDPGGHSRSQKGGSNGAQHKLAIQTSPALRNLVYEAGFPHTQPLPRSPASAAPSPGPLGLPQAGTGDAESRSRRNPAPKHRDWWRPTEEIGGSPGGCGPLTSHRSFRPSVGPLVCDHLRASVRKTLRSCYHPSLVGGREGGLT